MRSRDITMKIEKDLVPSIIIRVCYLCKLRPNQFAVRHENCEDTICPACFNRRYIYLSTTVQ